MVPLCSLSRLYRQEKVSFELIMPTQAKLRRLINNSNWAHLIDPEKYDDMSDKNERNLAAIQYCTAEEHFKAVDASVDLMLSVLPGIDRSRFKALEWSLNEITDNVLNHANSPIGGIMQVSTFPTKNRVEFYVCDAGITIPKSLRTGRPDIRDDTSALRAAIDEGVTRNLETNRGNGLFGTYKCCAVSGGDFEILSGFISLKSKTGSTTATRNKIPFHGTFVRASIDYRFDKLLEKALVFSGRNHDPGYDFIERKYQPNSETIEFHVATELQAFGSREAGRLARTKITNLMDNRSTPVEFDFDGVRIVSSSFADEVFGMLFLELGALSFNHLCRFKNIDSTVRSLIDRAIAQRMKF